MFFKASRLENAKQILVRIKQTSNDNAICSPRHQISSSNQKWERIINAPVTSSSK